MMVSHSCWHEIKGKTQPLLLWLDTWSVVSLAVACLAATLPSSQDEPGVTILDSERRRLDFSVCMKL